MTCGRKIGPYDCCSVVCGDCLELMKALPDGCVDLIYADPPFNVRKNYGMHSDAVGDYGRWVQEKSKEAQRILSPNGTVYWMTITRHVPLCLSAFCPGMELSNIVCWKHQSGSFGKRSFRPGYQPILIFVRGEYVFNTYAQTCSRQTERWGIYTTEYKGQMPDLWDDIQFVYSGSVVHPEAILEEGANGKAHPCQMPEGLPARAISFSSCEKATVLDPFLGSGTTAVAAKKLGRHFLGFEISPEYCRIARERIALVEAQPSLFEPRAEQLELPR